MVSIKRLVGLPDLPYLADKVGRDRFWPKDDAARGMARAMVAEMTHYKAHCDGAHDAAYD